MEKRDNYTVDEVALMVYSLIKVPKIFYVSFLGGKRIRYMNVSKYFEDTDLRPEIKNFRVNGVDISTEEVYVYAERFE